MKNERLEIILHRNQKNVVVDLVLALVFLFAAMTTAVAMKAAFDSLAGVPVAVSSPLAPPAANVIVPPCAHVDLAPAADVPVLAFAVSHAAGATLPR
jgi:hypothetical protein